MEKQKRNGRLIINVILGLICFVWTVPTFGLLVSSFRDRLQIQTSGWWTILPHREYRLVGEPITDLPRDFDNDVPFAIPATNSDVTHLFDVWREGVEVDGTRYRWVGNKRIGRLEVQERVWTMNNKFTLDNYDQVIGGKTYEYTDAEGNAKTEQGAGMGPSFINSLIVAIPATIIPILIAAFAAYGFAWMKFPGRRTLFIFIIALLVIPLQIALVPILTSYNELGIGGTFLAMWFAHTGFGLPMATYLLFNYISNLPRETLESAFIDGASHFTVFTRLILPLSVPALASFAIFQFLWVWNDYLVALIFFGETGEQVITMRLAALVGTKGSDWHLLTAGGFLTMLLPMIVFFSLQRYFVRGLLAGSVKG